MSLETPLLQYLVDFVRVEYLLRANPLGTMDDMALKIRDHQSCDFSHLHEFYVNLTGVFRYKFYSDNQLEFSFDRKDVFERYQEEWTVRFKEWTKSFCRHRHFLRAVLDLTVFYPADSPVLMVDNRMNAFIAQYFEVRIHPMRGIIQKMA